MKIVMLSTPEVEDKGKYNQLTVNYSADGKDQQKKVMSFTFKDVYETLKKTQAGDAFDIKLEKDGKYWNWTEAKSLGKEDVPTGTMVSKKGAGGWETPEERAARQIYIVRQSSISNALAYLALHKNAEELSVSTTLEIAKQFEDFVFSKGEAGEHTINDVI
jgi:hypothetical protein